MFWNGALAAKIVGGAVSAFAFVLRKGGNVRIEVRGAHVIVRDEASKEAVTIDCDK